MKYVLMLVEAKMYLVIEKNAKLNYRVWYWSEDISEATTFSKFNILRFFLKKELERMYGEIKFKKVIPLSAKINIKPTVSTRGRNESNNN